MNIINKTNLQVFLAQKILCDIIIEVTELTNLPNDNLGEITHLFNAVNEQVRYAYQFLESANSILRADSKNSPTMEGRT